VDLIGGTGSDYAQGVAADSASNMYVVGYTDSPSVDGQSNLGSTDAVVVKYNSAGTLTIWFCFRIESTSNVFIRSEAVYKVVWRQCRRSRLCDYYCPKQ
jgi:hypothetical protein